MRGNRRCFGLKRVYVNEKWCLACHLCEYYCAFANSNEKDMVKALKRHSNKSKNPGGTKG